MGWNAVKFVLMKFTIGIQSFVYRLRNALFHEIIDPLNEEWQLIFKNAYLVLKEIVDLNISEIGKTAIAENSVV